jgi:hypothetical protein
MKFIDNKTAFLHYRFAANDNYVGYSNDCKNIESIFESQIIKK